MEFSTLFARHFARLLWLLLHEPTNINEQKAALRAMVALSKFGAIGLESRDWQVVTNGVALPDSASGATELVAQMAVHGIRAVTFSIGPAAAHILGTTRYLATRPPEGDPGRAALAHLRTIGASSVTLVLEEPVTVGASANGTSSSYTNGSRASVIEASPVSIPVLEPPAPAQVPHVLRNDASPSPAAEAGEASEPSVDGHDDAAPEAGSGSHKPAAEVVPEEDRGGLWVHFSAVQAPGGTLEELFERLDRFHHADAVARVLDDLVITAENAAREGKGIVVADVFHGIVRREATLTADDLRRPYAMAIRRMARPALLRAVASLLPRKRERRDDFLAVLVRTGEDGADAVIDQLTQAPTAEDRRTFFGVLLHLQAGVPALIHMLGDARWFVARNAAELLGEMKAADAEEPLKQLLKHHDDRVRRAATTALVALDSPTARKVVYDAMHDGSPNVRMQAAAALAGSRDERSAGTLTRALDDEVDAEVQLAIIAALGKLATPEAVQRLIRAAEPDGRMFFRKKSTVLRLAAVQALAEARTPAAITALWELLEDKDREVRDLVQRVVGPLRPR